MKGLEKSFASQKLSSFGHSPQDTPPKNSPLDCVINGGFFASFKSLRRNIKTTKRAGPIGPALFVVGADEGT